MENIALSDSNDDLTNDIIENNNLTRPPPRMATEQQQHVASELQDAANTDVVKGILKYIYKYFFPIIILLY